MIRIGLLVIALGIFFGWEYGERAYEHPAAVWVRTPELDGWSQINGGAKLRWESYQVTDYDGLRLQFSFPTNDTIKEPQ